jgi:hypothetical protein
MPVKSANVLISGASNAAKLFAAALVVTGAYVAFSACGTAETPSTAKPAKTAMTATVLAAASTPSAASTLPAADPAVSQAGGQLNGRTAAIPGVLTVSPVRAGGPGCARSYVARTFLANPDPDGTVIYRWKLTRWSPATETWRTYLSHYDGFAAAGRAVEWRAELSGSPGWYRVELTAEGGETVKSRRFRVSC